MPTKQSIVLAGMSVYPRRPILLGVLRFPSDLRLKLGGSTDTKHVSLRVYDHLNFRYRILYRLYRMSLQMIYARYSLPSPRYNIGWA